MKHHSMLFGIQNQNFFVKKFCSYCGLYNKPFLINLKTNFSFHTRHQSFMTTINGTTTREHGHFQERAKHSVKNYLSRQDKPKFGKRRIIFVISTTIRMFLEFDKQKL